MNKIPKSVHNAIKLRKYKRVETPILQMLLSEVLKVI